MSSEVCRRLRPAVAALAACTLLTLVAPAPSGAGGRSQLTLTALEASTVQSINALRVGHGVAPLTVSPALLGSATFHCEQMVEGGYFGHVATGGAGTPRLATFYPQGRYRFYSVGENLLWTRAPVTGDQLVALWMKSPEHRMNLLNPAWREFAVAALRARQATGVYAGAPVTVVTVDFGVRR